MRKTALRETQSQLGVARQEAHFGNCSVFLEVSVGDYMRL